MVLWHRLRSARLGALWRLRAPPPVPASTAVAPPGENPVGLSPAIPTPRLLGYTSVRSFAAPVQAKQKPLADARSGPRINGAITAPFVRLVTEEGHGIVSRREALDRAMKLNLDLVEVQHNANPPVCKIMDFHKEKFKQELREKERAKSKSTIALRSGENKEVRFKAKTDLKDLKIKAETITRLMERGYRVKCTAMTTGKEEEDLGGLLSRLLTLIEDVSVVESGPHVDTSKAYVIVRHVKFTTKKSGKRVSKAMDSVMGGIQSAFHTVLETTGSTSRDEMALQAGEEWEQIDSSSDAESEVPSAFTKAACDGATNEGKDWAVFNEADNFKKVSDSDANVDVMNPVYGGKVGSSKPLHQKHPDASILCGSDLNRRPTAFKSGFNSLRAKQELQTEQASERISPGVVSSQPESSTAEVNRYSRKSKILPNQGRMPQQPLRNVREGHGQPDLKSRQPFPNFPSSQLPSYGNFSATGSASSGDQRNLGDTMFSRQSNPTSPAPKFGNFIAQKNAADSCDLRNMGGANPGKPSESTSPTPSYGIFGTSKTTPSTDQRVQGVSTAREPLNPSSSPPKYGIFSATDSSTTGDQKKLRDDVNVGKFGGTSSPTPSYGIFSTKSATSGDQRS